MPQPQPVQQAKSQNFTADEIRKLAQLRDEGVITDEEFTAKKKQLLGI
nr:SHOCT domain-containing protein [uncultured Ruminococcus sp.]